ncbi:MAG: RluA family pseudouridine synthase [Magnetococcales bacterium]|nr:RluA family pseudouridine synthase [Magnetococcales bacterium]
MTQDHEQKKSEVRHVTVETHWQDSRVDRFLAAQWPGVPPSLLHRLLRSGQIRVNSGRVAGGVRLKQGDVVRLPPIVLQVAPAQQQPTVPATVVRKIPQWTLWRDSHLLILNKPAGIVVHSGSDQPWGMIDAVRLWFSQYEPEVTPELCHRLDRDTSGCLLFGLHPAATRAWMEQLRHGQVDKQYVALVHGVVRQNSGTIQLPLVKGSLHSGERMVTAGANQANGRHAVTHFRVVQRFATTTLIELVLATGRTHQIRAHMQELGHPVAGDGKYGDRLGNRRLAGNGLRRMFLHAQRLVFSHPITGQRIEVQSSLPPDLAGLLQQLG